MAITGSITTPSQETYANSYVKVCEITQNLEDQVVSFRATIHKTQTSYDNEEAIVEPVKTYLIEDAHYTTYFADAVLDTVNKRTETQCEQYLINEESRFSGFTTV